MKAFAIVSFTLFDFNKHFVQVLLAIVATKADSDAESNAYTLGQIAYGLPQHNAYATGHPHNVGVITGVDYGHGRVSGYGAIGNRGYYGGYGAGHIGHVGYNGHIGYSGYGGHYYGKREAEAEPEADANADADPYYNYGYAGLGYSVPWVTYAHQQSAITPVVSQALDTSAPVVSSYSRQIPQTVSNIDLRTSKLIPHTVSGLNLRTYGHSLGSGFFYG